MLHKKQSLENWSVETHVNMYHAALCCTNLRIIYKKIKTLDNLVAAEKKSKFENKLEDALESLHQFESRNAWKSCDVEFKVQLFEIHMDCINALSMIFN